MCGIIGFTGNQPAADILLEGLARLEYRGYDSAGIAVMNGASLSVQKAKGRLENLRALVSATPPTGTTGIGHTRWATHGEPSDVNAHPHADESGRIVLVHNGIIENYRSLKAMLIKQGVHFASETDTEVVVQLLSRAYRGDMIEAIRHTVGQLKGSFALGILCVDYPGQIFCLRKDSPLIVGESKEGCFLASDIPAILPYTRTVYMLESEEIAVLSATGVSFCDLLGGRIKKQATEITWDVKAAEKGGYRHFMMKEIREQPAVIHDTLSPYTEEKDGLLSPANLPLPEEIAQNVGSVTLIGCGTAYHAGMVGQYLLERFVRLRAATDIASEYRYRDPLIEKDELVIVISQSGETADTIAAMRLAQKRGAKVLAVCNVVGSTIAREADFVCHTCAGPEIAVASTKAYVSQLTVLYVLALYFARVRGTMSAQEISDLLKEFFTLPENAE
ncbi:MAG: glutamine--fructose-6-phosphate transaminase (isomerizing), partial [Clostridia bacterium]|nr:glutamine--fructose-6-phosphate transaminase (isomerizing) [Clostridia bacterium]